VIGLLGAMSEEIELVKSQMKNISVIKLAGNIFYKGTIGNKNVILTKSGIGPVNASITTTLLISHFHTKSIIFTGVSGAIINDLKLGDIVIGTNFVYCDVDHTIFGLKLGQISREKIWQYPADQKLVYLAISIAQEILSNRQAIKGKIISEDVFITDRRTKINLAR